MPPSRSNYGCEPRSAAATPASAAARSAAALPLFSGATVPRDFLGGGFRAAEQVGDRFFPRGNALVARGEIFLALLFDLVLFGLRAFFSGWLVVVVELSPRLRSLALFA